MPYCPKCSHFSFADPQCLFDCPHCGYVEPPVQPEEKPESEAYQRYRKEAEASAARFHELMTFVLGQRPDD